MEGITESLLPTPQPEITVHTLGGWRIGLNGSQESVEHALCGSLMCEFPVTSPGGESAVVTVEIVESLQDEVRRSVGPRFPDDEAFWRALAEDALTSILDERDDFPTDHRMRVESLTLDQFDLALNWNRKEA